MSVKIKILASGSCGNSYFVSDGETRLLIDAGITCDRIDKELETIGESAAKIDAVFLTHEHGDHIRGLHGLVKSYQPWVFSSRGPLLSIQSLILDPLRALRMSLPAEAVYRFQTISVLPMIVPHDAAEPVGYTFLVGGIRCAFIADVGFISESMADVLRDVDFLFLESNHDIALLDAGAYLPRLKARVFSHHLSNLQVGRFLSEHIEPSVKYLVLGHLSSSNNRAELVGTVALEALRTRRVSPELTVISPNQGSPVFVF